MPIRTSPVLVGNSDPSWLGSAHGTDATQSITLDVSKFTQATYWPKGRILSGEPLVKLASGLYGPYEGDDEKPADVLAGFLFADVPVTSGDTQVPGAILLHGQVISANLPHPIDSDGAADVAGSIIIR